MSPAPRDLDAGPITFHACCLPPLDAGEYQLEVRHDLPQLQKTYEKRLSFSVDAPRFGLKPDDVYAVFPPKGHAGDFGNALPHVVFTRRTLPWETTIAGGKRDEKDVRPWMALIVLGESDFPDGEFPRVVPRPISAAVGNQDGVIGPAIEPREDEKGNLCNTIDLDGEIFRQVAPSLQDLDYLAHVREVGTQDKETSSFLVDADVEGREPKAQFSIVVANRMPEQSAANKVADRGPAGGIENRVFLISLAGMGGHLPPQSPAEAKTLRLVVLSSWSFRCNKAFEFKAAMGSIKRGRLALPEPKSDGGAAAAEIVRRASALGYAALAHQTRAGKQVISWYRGPLIPYYAAKEDDYAFRSSVDAALRYSRDTGMLDVSYAGAYQLGRLLAMQDRHFATALQAFRQDVRRRVNETRDGVRNGGHAAGDEPGSPLRRLLGGAPIAERTSAPGTVGIQVPGTISRWLARTSLLYRVPFAYLVPDPRLLEPGWIRFFDLDPSWLKSLMEGACSVGRTALRDELVDRLLAESFFGFAADAAARVRTRKPDPDSEFDRETSIDLTTPDVETEATGKADRSIWRRSGFLMRSPVVEGWQGLEMRAWEGETPLSALRIDRLSPEVLLCIFDGDVTKMQITQPPEGTHFGATVEGTSYFKSAIRTEKKVIKKEGDDRIRLPLRKQERERVVKVGDLARLLAQQLEASTFSSAHFAVQMVEAPARATLIREDVKSQ